MQSRDQSGTFETAGPMLVGLAYRILGSRADAEDAVQDTFLKWQQADKDKIENPAAWLRTVCTRRCLDLLQSAHRARVDYVGTWLPEPIQTPVLGEAEEALTLASSLTTAFLLLLERLTPKERAAFLLREIFDVSYREIAATLAVDESACRQLVSRARAHVEEAKVRTVTPIVRQDELLAAFEAAISTGDTGRLAAMLADDIALSADGGGKVPAVSRVLHGKAEVLEFVAQNLRQHWAGYRWVTATINGGRGVVLEKDGLVAAAVSFAYDETGRATGIYIMRNPDKLARLSASAIS